MRKPFLILICLFMVCALCSCSNKPAENPASDFEYELSPDEQHVVITKYVGESKNVVIPSKIDGLAVTALKGLDVDGFIQGVFQDTDVETVVIPDTVQWIGNRAFMNCTALSSVDIESGSELNTIGVEAFENCSSLKSINIENAKELKSIGAKAFNNCESIEQLKLPSKLEKIGAEAFSNCLKLKSVNIPAKVELMNIDGARFFNVPALEEIIFDEGWENIQGYVFFDITSEVKITIPESVTGIGVTTFANNGAIKMYFEGDCPGLLDGDRFYGDVTVYYDPDSEGWDTTPLKEVHTLIPN